MREPSNLGFASKHLYPLPDEGKRIISELSAMKISDFGEQDIREEYLAPIVHWLGYGRGTAHDVKREENFSLSPGFINIGRQSVKVDYRFPVYKQGFWLLEAKPAKPYAKDKSKPDDEDIGQAFFYALHPQIDAPYFAVSNGWWFLLFERDSETPTIPILEVQQHELGEKFDDLRRIIAADQVTFYLKERLLRRIEQVLGADCVPERTEQFVEAVKRVGDKVRSIVIENFRAARSDCETEEKKQIEDLFAPLNLFDMAGWPMEFAHCKQDAEIVSTAVINKLRNDETDWHFYSRLCIEEPRLVSISHHFNTLFLLSKITELDDRLIPWIPRDLKQTGTTEIRASELLAWYAKLLLTRFKEPDRPDLQILWLLEAVVARIAKRLILCSPTQRNAILAQISSEHYFKTEQTIANENPNPARNLLGLIETQKRPVMGNFFRQHYKAKKRQWSRELAIQDFENLLATEKYVEEKTPDYDKIRDTLGSSWSELTFIDVANKPWDQLGAGICGTLVGFPSILKRLPVEIQTLIKNLASAKTNWAEECCKIMEIEFEEYSSVEIAVEQKKLYLPQY